MTFPIIKLSISVTLLVLPRYSIALHNNEYNTGVNEFNHALVQESQPITSINETAADILWDFRFGLEGWAGATYSEMRADVYQEDGQLKMRIQDEAGSQAYIASPHIYLPVGDRRVFVMRYRYIGKKTYGKVIVFGSFSDVDITFPIVGDGQWRTAYAKFYSHTGEFDKVVDKCHGNITKIHIHPVAFDDSNDQRGDTFYIDWIRLVRGPVIESVIGCNGGRLYSKDRNLTNIAIFASLSKQNVSESLVQYNTLWSDPLPTSEFKYAMSYNCRRQGGERITIRGMNFGMRTNVYIGGNECKHVTHNLAFPQQELSCTTPEMGIIDKPDVTLQNSFLPGLVDAAPYFMYALKPPPPEKLLVSNVAARSVDISWSVSGNLWQQLTYTGFHIQWRLSTSISFEYKSSMSVGNVTTTTVRGLEPDKDYIFTIRGIVDDQGSNMWKELDAYGRRKLSAETMIGDINEIKAHTLLHDIHIPFFNANSTQNSGSFYNVSTFGASGYSGEGHYGLIFVGDTSIANCNASSVCCDVIDSAGNCAVGSYFCMPWFESDINYQSDISSSSTGSREQPGGGIVVETMDESRTHQSYSFVNCGPELRLTGSHRKQVGAAWYSRQLDVAEGFESSFTFRISNPSFRCNNLDDVHTRCRSRGADGFAFVVQNDGPYSIGNDGHNMGYDIPNSLAIEFDTYYNHEMEEPYENHISIHTRGSNSSIPNSPHQLYSLYSTSDIPDLTDGEINVRIVYKPNFDIDSVFQPQFGSYPHLASNRTWLENGLGMIYIFIGRGNEQDVFTSNSRPVLVTPVNLLKVLDLKRDRKAWVGFTSATGVDSWQAHDILCWNFTSLRLDSDVIQRAADLKTS